MKTLLLFGTLIGAASISIAQTPSATNRATGKQGPPLAAIQRIVNDRYGTLTVINTNGEPLGIIRELVVDRESARPQFAILDVSDDIIPTNAVVPVPHQLLKELPQRLQLDVTKERLRSAPRFAPDAWWPELQKGDWPQKIRAHFGVGNQTSPVAPASDTKEKTSGKEPTNRKR